MLASRLLRAAVSACALVAAIPLMAQERLPWERGPPSTPRDDAYRPNDTYTQRKGGTGNYIDGYRQEGYQDADRYDSRSRGSSASAGQAGRPYGPPPDEEETGNYSYRPPPPDGRPPPNYGYGPPPSDGTYSRDEILIAGHRFFGSISQGLAKVVEYAFQRSGRPNGYILGEDAGAAFVAGLRYGEGVLYTKDAGHHKVYWQGPSLGYDFGAEGSKTMVLVYNLRHPHEIYNRFGGIQGSAYLVGGVSIQFQSHEGVILAPIRAGVGVRLGANVGYLKYTPTRTWNPF